MSNCIIYRLLQSKTQEVPIQSDDIRNAVVTNWVEYKKHKKLQSISKLYVPVTVHREQSVKKEYQQDATI